MDLLTEVSRARKTSCASSLASIREIPAGIRKALATMPGGKRSQPNDGRRVLRRGLLCGQFKKISTSRRCLLSSEKNGVRPFRETSQCVPRGYLGPVSVVSFLALCLQAQISIGTRNGITRDSQGESISGARVQAVFHSLSHRCILAVALPRRVNRQLWTSSPTWSSIPRAAPLSN